MSPERFVKGESERTYAHIDFPSLEFMVSVLVAAVRGCERKAELVAM